MQDIETIKHFPFTEEVRDLPEAGDSNLLQLGLDDWAEITSSDPELSQFAQTFDRDIRNHAILQSIFGNSPYLSRCLLSDVGFFSYLIRHGSKAALDWIYRTLNANVSNETDRAAIMAQIRIGKHRIALLTALCDIGHVWPLMQVTKVLSDYADAAVEICCNHLLSNAAAKGDIVLANEDAPTKDSGLIVLGMGKLGAQELNYSSDIDLIILFESDHITYTGRHSVQDCFVKIARNLVQMMQERTVDGYVFRTDLRLRPDPGATPIALSVNAAHVYYESQGQNWERAAMIKARPIAGDMAAGEEFMTFLIPFIWRKSMDFAAIEDIQAIKTQIHTHKGFAEISMDGHNIKIGRGGIREVEFFCQTQQLIDGGRNPLFRTKTTLDTLMQLKLEEKIPPDVHLELQDAYIFLRTLEHRLQMINDEQTQTLPDQASEFAKLGVFFGYPNVDEFREALFQTLASVRRHYDALFEFEKSPDRKAGRLVFTGSDDDPETLSSLSELGFQEPEKISQKIRDWHHGRYRATRTVRAKQTLTELTPNLLEALADTTEPDAAFIHFDVFLQKLPAGVQLFSLFKAYPSLLELLAQIMGMAPYLASSLAQNPQLLDGVLSTDFLGQTPLREELEESFDLMLSTAQDYQDVLDISRRWANDEKFRIGVQILKNVDHGTGKGATVTAGPALTDIAEVILDRLFPKVKEELAVRHGVIPGGQFAIVAAGKMGSRQMRPGSDADLIFVFNTPEDGMMTDGGKSIPAGLFYTRLSQRFINALSVLTGEGNLYEVDMRLRPHGKSGPIALNLEGFKKYYQDEAWTWEHLALTRARTVAGDSSFRAEVDNTLHDINSTKRDPKKIRKDVASMRARVHKEFATGSVWSIKHAVGGLMDLEFLGQYLRLVHGHTHPDILEPNTIDCFQALSRLDLILPDEAEKLIEISNLYLNISGLLQICLGSRQMSDDTPQALRSALAKAGNSASFDELREKLETAQSYVNTLAGKYIGTNDRKETT